jgi:hypothetical protein
LTRDPLALAQAISLETVTSQEGTMRRLFLGLAITGFAALTPSWLLAGDQEVAQQIAANLKNSGKMHGYSVGVKVQEGTVWLNGTVKSQEQLATALDIVQDTPGIEKIVNGLSVSGGTGQEAVRQASGDSSSGATAQLAIGGQSDYNKPDYETAPSKSVLAATHTSAVPPAYASAPSQNSGVPLPLSSAPRVAAQPRMAQQMPVEMASSMQNGAPIPAYMPAAGGGIAPAHFDHPTMPGYAWPSYASYPNYAALTYPRQYSPTAWPFIGPFYPYPQVPLGWRKVSLEWHNGWWMLDFNDGCK